MKPLFLLLLLLVSACTSAPPRSRGPLADPLVPLLAYYHRHGIDLEFEITDARERPGLSRVAQPPSAVVRAQYAVKTVSPAPIQTVVTLFVSGSRDALRTELIRLPLRSTLHPRAPLAVAVWARPHPTLPDPPTPADYSRAAALRDDIDSLFSSYVPPER